MRERKHQIKKELAGKSGASSPGYSSLSWYTI